MKVTTSACFSLLGIALVTSATPTLADSAEATCKVRKEGEKDKKASGPCSFSQRQGHVTIELANGNTVDLTPQDRANEFKDAKGKKVMRTASGNEHEYKWKGGRTITVTFGAKPAQQDAGEPHHGDHGPHKLGETPRDLRDLVNGKLVGGEVDDELTKRGYKHAKNSVSGEDVWSNWTDESGKNCVTVHFNAGQVESIVNAPDLDCQK